MYDSDGENGRILQKSREMYEPLGRESYISEHSSKNGPFCLLESYISRLFCNNRLSQQIESYIPARFEQPMVEAHLKVQPEQTLKHNLEVQVLAQQ